MFTPISKTKCTSTSAVGMPHSLFLHQFLLQENTSVMVGTQAILSGLQLHKKGDGLVKERLTEHFMKCSPGGYPAASVQSLYGVCLPMHNVIIYDPSFMHSNHIAGVAGWCGVFQYLCSNKSRHL